MQNPVKERIVKLREEIAQISEANRLYLQSGKNKLDAAGDNARRLQRLQEIAALPTELRRPAFDSKWESGKRKAKENRGRMGILGAKLLWLDTGLR